MKASTHMGLDGTILTTEYKVSICSSEGGKGRELTGSITRLDELGGVLDGFTGTTINLLQDLRELAGNVGSVAIKDWGVTSTDLTRVVENNDLSVERLGSLGRIVLRVTSDVTTTDFLDRDVLDVEANIVSGKTLNKLLVVHLDGLDFSGDL